MAKTKMNVISIFDGKQDVTDAFVALIAERIHDKKSRKDLPKEGHPCYDRDKVQVTSGLASGLCG